MSTPDVRSNAAAGGNFQWQDFFPQLPQDRTPWAMTEQGKREQIANNGFSGTLREFIEWLDFLQIGGFVKLYEETTAHPWRSEERLRSLHLVTGGHSTAEHVFGLASRSLHFRRYWESSHRGGLDVYQIPVSALESEEVFEWVQPASQILEQYHRVRHIEVVAQDGTSHSFDLQYGAEVLLLDPEHILDARGRADSTLIVRGIPKERTIWLQ